MIPNEEKMGAWDFQAPGLSAWGECKAAGIGAAVKSRVSGKVLPVAGPRPRAPARRSLFRMPRGQPLGRAAFCLRPGKSRMTPGQGAHACRQSARARPRRHRPAVPGGLSGFAVPLQTGCFGGFDKAARITVPGRLAERREFCHDGRIDAVGFGLFFAFSDRKCLEQGAFQTFLRKVQFPAASTPCCGG